MTFRFEEVQYQKTSRTGDHAWHWRFKGVYDKGVYGSIVTNPQGSGVYLLAERDYPGLPRDWEQRLTCLAPPANFSIASDVTVDEAMDALAEALLQLGWGTRVR